MSDHPLASAPTAAPVPAPAGTAAGAARPPHGRPWWRNAVIYQVYVRSFATGPAPADGHVAERDDVGVGNLAGVRSRLTYLADLGIDAIWFNPWYSSPGADAGYDVADYRSVDPLFGTLEEAEKLIAEAHQLGIRIILDIVPNHGSDQQQWFTDALAAPPGSAERARYISARGAANCRRTTGSRSSAAPPGPARPGRMASRGSGTCTCSPPAARLQLGQPRGAGGVRGRAAVLVRPRGGRVPYRLGRAAGQGPGAGRHRARPRRRAITRSWIRTGCTTSTGPGAASRTSTRAIAC